MSGDQERPLMALLRGWMAGRTAYTGERARRERVDLTGLDPDIILYAVGDIHGRHDLLLAAEDRIAGDLSRHGREGLVLYLGDYVDRGPDSRSVLDHLSRSAEAPFLGLPLAGNHDVEFLKFLDSPETTLHWLEFGGLQTLRSYGVDTVNGLRGGKDLAALGATLATAIPVDHVRFLESLPAAAFTATHLFVHAGIRPGLPLDEQHDHDLMWIREPFLSDGPRLQTIVVHGHTIFSEPDLGLGRIGIDTGAYATGRLTVLRIDGAATSFL